MSYPPQGRLEPRIETVEIADNAVTDVKIASHVSTKIIGLPTQTQAQNMGNNDIINITQLQLQTMIEQTIATGSIAFERSELVLDTEADAATDDLDNITGSSGGDIIIGLVTFASARDPTLRDTIGGAGQLLLAGNFTHDSANDSISLYRHSSDFWIELSRSNNA